MSLAAELAQAEAERLERIEATLARVERAVAALAATQGARGMSPAEFAKASGLSLATVYRNVSAGLLVHRRIGSRIVIPSSALEPGSGDEIVRRAREARP